ncbi:MAG: excinuclease ABC subunit UvrA, partial [bacterium]|nr:excinuclease ABC subunit UvrA [bacterium]
MNQSAFPQTVTKDPSHSTIFIKNARVHNLKNISLEVPKHQVVVFTGVSGSGKSSLVFDTIFTEAQRQLVETFSTFARARLPKLSRPHVDDIRNISTAIIIDQKKMGRNIRSTVGTATEIYTHLRLLFSRCGSPLIGPSFMFGFNHPEGMCPACSGMGKQIKIDTSLMIDKNKSIRDGAINHPDYKIGGWNWREMAAIKLFNCHIPLRDFPPDELNNLLYAKSIPIEKNHGAGTYTKNFEGIVRKLERLHINKGEDQLSEARKNAYQKYFIYTHCHACSGSRLNDRARSVLINGKSIDQLAALELTDLDAFLARLDNPIARPLVRKIRAVLSHLIAIGVGYLSINRAVGTLSGGESQRVKMARQLDCDLVDMMYILDEPSIGLHPRDTGKLIDMLFQIKDKGNSVFVVEHDPDVIRAADWIIDIGPHAGMHGGELVFSGTVDSIAQSNSITGQYLNSYVNTSGNSSRERKKAQGYYDIKNASVNNLKNVSVRIPRGILTCVTGVAGSGKSSLINEVFIKLFREAIVIDQSPAGKSSRSNPATYTGMFDIIRKEFARSSGSDASLFSFNSKGACPKCKGSGFLSVEMSFLDDISITCDECGGKKYRDEVLELSHNGKNIFDILEMTINAALDFFDVPGIVKRLKILRDVGLGYLKIGQSLSSLSGGEAQRIKLASELHK